MNQKKILIVDDDEKFLKMLRSAFGLCCPDCQVESASSGPAALNVFQAQPIDLLLTDYSMPHMNGLELARVVRKTWPQTRIVLMSTNKAAVEAATHSFSFDDYLVKPFALRELAKVLQLNQ
jgi:two-component system response regulator YesN